MCINNSEYDLIFNYIKNKIIETPIIMYPYPHIDIDELLPLNLYEIMLDDLKNIDLIWNVYFLPHKNNNITTREQVNLINELITDDNKWFDTKKIKESLIVNNKIINDSSWNIFRNILVSVNFQLILIEKFKILLKDRIIDKDPLNFKKDVTINRDKCNFKIDPHTDPKDKLLFGVFYMSELNLPIQPDYSLGTDLYIHNFGLKSWKSKPVIGYNKNDFIKVKTINYVPNKMAIFLKTDESWHGINVQIPDNYVRHTVYYSISE